MSRADAEKTGRLFFLDAARGFCMILVILGHIWETDEPLPVLIYSFHVPLFFIISGILLRYTRAADRGIRRFVLSGLKNLLLPYAFYEILFITLYGILNRFDFGGRNIFGGFLLNPLNVPLWFLPALFFCELLILLLLRADKSGRLTAAVSAVLYLIPFFAKSGGGFLLPAALRCCSSAGFTALGYVSCDFVLSRDLPFAALIPLLVLDGVCALFNGKTGIYKLTFGNPFVFTLCAVTGSFAVLFLFKKRRIRLLEWIGKNTLVILGLHIIALRVIQLIPGLHTDTFIGGIVSAVLVCALLTPAILVLNRLTGRSAADGRHIRGRL